MINENGIINGDYFKKNDAQNGNAFKNDKKVQENIQKEEKPLREEKVLKVEDKESKKQLPKTYKRNPVSTRFFVADEIYDIFENERQELLELQKHFDELEAQYPEKVINFAKNEEKTVSIDDCYENLYFWNRVQELKAFSEAEKTYKKSNSLSYAYKVFCKNSLNKQLANGFEYEGCQIKRNKNGFVILSDKNERFKEGACISFKEPVYMVDGVDFSPVTLAKKELAAFKKELNEFSNFRKNIINRTVLEGAVFYRKDLNTLYDVTFKEIDKNRTKNNEIKKEIEKNIKK